MKREIHPQTAILSTFVYNRRKQFKLSMVALARKAGCSYITIYNLENCEANPSWAMAINILNALDTSLSEFAAWERGNYDEEM